MEVGIVAQRGNARAAYLAGSLAEHLREAAVEVALDEETAEELAEAGTPMAAMDACDLLVSIGGDGTFLYVARGADATPIVGVNLGEVGFLNAVAPEDAVETVLDIVETYRETGAVPSDERPRLAASGDDWALPPALNEVVVTGPQRGHGQGIEIEVRVDGSLFTGGHADGALVATPTGSTAYNLSEGGPLVHPGIDAAVVTEMVGTEPMPPLVVDLDSTVTVRVDGAPTAAAISDGRTSRPIEPPATVTIERAGSPVLLAGPGGEFFEALGKLD